MTDVFTLKWSFGGPQHVRSYTAWPNRARGSFSQQNRSFDPKVWTGPTEPVVLLHTCALNINYQNTIVKRFMHFFPLPSVHKVVHQKVHKVAAHKVVYQA